MYRLLRAPIRGITYTRWLHLLVPILIVSIWLFIEPASPWMPALIVAPFGLLPWVRLAEGLQAQFLLTPDERGRHDGSISTAASKKWGDRWRTVLWLEIRLTLAGAAAAATVWLPYITMELVLVATGRPLDADVVLLPFAPPRWAAGLLVPVPLLVMLLTVVLLGEAVTAIARKLLGPSVAERMSALEARTEQLLERTRIARELHDSIGHALTVAVVQAGAARAAGDPKFTDRALSAIEETGRAALEDLERVLMVLRESAQAPSQTRIRR